MTELNASVRLDMSSNLETRTRRATQAMERMSQRGQRHMRVLSGSMRLMGQGLDQLGNRYTAFLTGGGLALAGRQVVALETRFTRLGIQANRSTQEMNALKAQIYEAAQAPDIRVDPGEITGAIEAIVEKTGDLDFARENIRNIGMAIQATGAGGQAIGELLAEMQKMGAFKGPQDVLSALDMLTLQGKEGAFTLQNLAALGPRVITAYASATKGARDGATVLQEMGTALQIIRMGTGSSEQAATAFERLMAELQDTEKLKLLQSGGIQVFDPKQPGAEVMRPVNEILLEILAKTKGKRTILGQIFGDEAIRTFNALDPEKVGKFMAMQGDGSTMMGDSARAAGTAAAAIQSLSTAWEKFADQELAGPINSLTAALDGLEPGTVDRWLQTGKVLGMIAGGAVAARKGLGAYRFLRNALGGGSGVGRALGGAGAAAGGVTPVFVTNMAGGGMGSMGSNADRGVLGRARDLARRGPTVGRLAGMGAKGIGMLGGGVLSAGMAGWEIGGAINSAGESLAKGTALEGAGTDYIGGGIARVLSFFGNEEARRAVEATEKAKAQLEVKVTDDRVKVSRLSADGMDVDVDAGAYMAGP